MPIMSTTWANVPEELFERILDVYTLGDVIYRQEGFVNTTKAALGKLSLVNRYFADICQPKLFNTVALRSRTDVHELLELIGTPGSRIADYISSLELPPQLYGSAEPWIHLFYLIQGKMYSGIPLTLTIQAKKLLLKEKPLRVRSIHAGLPRTVPGMFSGGIRILTLQDFHFTAFSDLVNLVLELRGLKTLKCSNITWVGEPLSLPRRRSRVPLQFVSMTRCTMDWYAVWLLVALGREHREIQATERDLAVVTESVQVLPTAPRGDAHPTVHVGFVDTSEASSPRIVSRHLECYVSFKEPVSRRAPDIPIARIYYTFHWPVSLPTSTDLIPATTLSHIRSIAVDFSAECVLFDDAFEASCDWAAFDKSISSFPVLRQVTMGFMFQDDMTRFVKGVAEVTMTQLGKDGKVRYALRQPWDKYRVLSWADVSEKQDWIKGASSSRLYEL